jgi:hypothetical protein
LEGSSIDVPKWKIRKKVIRTMLIPDHVISGKLFERRTASAVIIITVLMRTRAMKPARAR